MNIYVPEFDTVLSAGTAPYNEIIDAEFVCALSINQMEELFTRDPANVTSFNPLAFGLTGTTGIIGYENDSNQKINGDYTTLGFNSNSNTLFDFILLQNIGSTGRTILFEENTTGMTWGSTGATGITGGTWGVTGMFSSLSTGFIRNTAGSNTAPFNYKTQNQESNEFGKINCAEMSIFQYGNSLSNNYDCLASVYVSSGIDECVNDLVSIGCDGKTYIKNTICNDINNPGSTGNLGYNGNTGATGDTGNIGIGAHPIATRIKYALDQYHGNTDINSSKMGFTGNDSISWKTQYTYSTNASTKKLNVKMVLKVIDDNDLSPYTWDPVKYYRTATDTSFDLCNKLTYYQQGPKYSIPNSPYLDNSVKGYTVSADNKIGSTY
jgi:hypothetical protein